MHRHLGFGVALVAGMAATMPLQAAMGASQARTMAIILNGNTLLDMCNHAPNECEAYTAGIADMLSYTTAFGGAGGMGMCIPDVVHVTPGQIRDIIVADLNARPEVRHEAAASLAAYALTKAFPCPPKQ